MLNLIPFFSNSFFILFKSLLIVILDVSNFSIKLDIFSFFTVVISKNFIKFLLFSIVTGSASFTISFILFILLSLSNLKIPDLFLYMGLMLNIDKTKLIFSISYLTILSEISNFSFSFLIETSSPEEKISNIFISLLFSIRSP